MRNIFIINGGQIFGHSGGLFNKTITEKTYNFFKGQSGFEVRVTDINDDYNVEAQVENYKWADVVIYHTPIWWFQVPHEFKKFIDVVFTAGHQKGIYTSDGRSSANPAINYGTGGSLQGKQYLLTTSWNAPQEAFKLAGEFFNQTSVDEGVMFGFHRMNAFTGMTPMKSIHFHDVEKNADVLNDMARYEEHLTALFVTNEVLEETM